MDADTRIDPTPPPVADAARDVTLPLLTLYEISKILSASLNLDTTLREVMGVLASWLGLRRGTIALAGDGGGGGSAPEPLALVATVGLSLEAARAGRGAYPLEVAAQVHRSGVPLVARRMAEDERLAEYLACNGGLETDDVSFFCVPIKAGDGTIGTLSVERAWDDDGPRSVDPDLRFLTMVGNLVGQTVRLHRLIAADRRTLLADAARLEKQARAGRAALGQGSSTGGPRFSEIIGRGPAMTGVLDQVRHVARTRAPVMLRGESGTGKEMIARAIHRVSPRADKPFVGVNCAALPDTLLESELFGHDKGAFTGAGGERKGRFEAADGGTLFLDEIGEISPAFQAKLLRVLQEGQFERLGSSRTRSVDVRIIAATNRNLEEAVSRGDFRADLYYRINVVTLVLPPLRDRREDIEPLARHFLDRFNAENGDSLGFSPDALALLSACTFPGNVRELENCITRVATMVRGDVIRADDFACREAGCLSAVLGRELECGTHAGGAPLGCVHRPAPPTAPVASPAGSEPAGGTGATASADEGQDDAGGSGGGAAAAGDGTGVGRLPDRARLIEAMEKTGWVQAKAARLLGLTPRQVGYALRRHDIRIKRL